MAPSRCRGTTKAQNGRRDSRSIIGGFESRPKKKVIKEAKEAAKELYLDARYRVERRGQARDRPHAEGFGGRTGKKVYRDYIQAINNYLIPHFGAHHMDQINYALIQQFGLWRAEKIGKEPKASALNTHSGALN
jgi:hypothetical protein